MGRRTLKVSFDVDGNILCVAEKDFRCKNRRRGTPDPDGDEICTRCKTYVLVTPQDLAALESQVNERDELRARLAEVEAALDIAVSHIDDEFCPPNPPAEYRQKCWRAYCLSSAKGAKT
jgi:hypothetical protein